MNAAIEAIDTVILVMMENRSFDHMLGHLSFEGINTEVDGLRAPLQQYENLYQGDMYNPAPTVDGPMPHDLPHEYTAVAEQMALSPVTQEYTMAGFVSSYGKQFGGVVSPPAEPMKFFPSDQVPITSFLARNYVTCDRWFSSLPTSTQPNRTFAFCGASSIHLTKPQLIPCSDIIFDWLNRAGVRWRVYHDGFSFFSLYKRAWPHVLGPNFRDFEQMLYDLEHESISVAPQVIIVEPTYEDAPHLGSDQPNDNHAPLAVGWGEEFLRRTYQAARVNPEKWARTLMVLYYDEHGGFWDHVPPPHLPYVTDAGHSFDSLGPRIPAIVISPLVEAGSVCSAVMDHSSVLQLLAELFTPGKPYSEDVEIRQHQGIVSLSAVLAQGKQRLHTPNAPSLAIHVRSALGESIIQPPGDGMKGAFESAATQMMAEEPTAVSIKYPELYGWRQAVKEAGEGE